MVDPWDEYRHDLTHWAGVRFPDATGISVLVRELKSTLPVDAEFLGLLEDDEPEGIFGLASTADRIWKIWLRLDIQEITLRSFPLAEDSVRVELRAGETVTSGAGHVLKLKRHWHFWTDSWSLGFSTEVMPGRDLRDSAERYAASLAARVGWMIGSDGA